MMPLLVSMMAGALAAEAAPHPSVAPIEDKPGLPRVLLIGDSISMGYTIPTRELLADVANVHRAPTNCGPTIRALAGLDAWLGEGKWDVIHFNFGLHDLRHMEDGTHQVPIGKYEANLRTIVARLKDTGAKLVWASTTPVPEGELTPKRTFGDGIAYNKVAAEVMREERVPINDLYAFALPKLAEIQRPHDVHFTDEGSRVLAKQVEAAIVQALSGK